MVDLDRATGNAGRNEDQTTLIEDILFSINPDSNFSGEAKGIFRVSANKTNDLVSVTNPGAINYLVGVATPEPGAVDRKEVLEAVLIDLHYMG